MKLFEIRFGLLIHFILFVLVLSGCGEKKPDGLPKLYPVSLQFVQEGIPCSEASVHLIPQSGSPWAVGGSTDATGTVTFKTHGKYPGVPVGKYKITVSKVDREEIGPPPKNMFELQREVVMYDLIDPVYSNPGKTPLEIEVVQGKKHSATFDLGKNIRTKIVKPGE